MSELAKGTANHEVCMAVSDALVVVAVLACIAHVSLREVRRLAGSFPARQFWRDERFVGTLLET